MNGEIRFVTKISMKGVWHTRKKLLREEKRESAGKNNEKIESHIEKQNKKASKMLM